MGDPADHGPADDQAVTGLVPGQTEMSAVGNADLPGHRPQVGPYDGPGSVGDRDLQGQAARQPAVAFPGVDIEMRGIVCPRRTQRPRDGIDGFDCAADILLEGMRQIPRFLCRPFQVGVILLVKVAGNPQSRATIGAVARARRMGM